MRTVLGVLALAAVAGCMASGPFPQLAKEDQELFHRCWASMQRALCGDDTGEMYLAICRRDAAQKYAQRPDGKRGKWLVARGCPAGMVAAAEEENDDDAR